MTTERKPLTDEQRAEKNRKERERVARKKAEREAALAAADAKPDPKPDDPAPTLSASLLIYDIPSASDYSNPSHQLRRIGFRANLSCWVIPDGAIPRTLIHEMRTEGNANVDLVRFDAAEGPRLAKMAVAAMEKEVADQAARAREGIAGMADRHLDLPDDLATNESAREDAVKRYERRSARVLRHLNEAIEDVEAAIKNFGLSPEKLNLADARKAFETLQIGYQAKAAEFVRATNALKAVGTVDATALANAAAKDEVMPEVIADMLRENGKEAEADALQAAFAPPAAPVNDDVFDLV